MVLGLVVALILGLVVLLVLIVLRITRHSDSPSFVVGYGFSMSVPHAVIHKNLN